jgi:hypothetical protein
MSDNTTINFDNLRNGLAEECTALQIKYNISQRDMAMFIDMIKKFAAVYNQLVLTGEIPKDEQYTHNPLKAIELINEVLAEDGSEEV